jgi:hypothetical protein
VGESLLANYELKPTTVYDGGSLWTAYVPDGIWQICMYVLEKLLMVISLCACFL